MEIHLHFGGATDTEQPHDPQNLQESKNTTTKKRETKRDGVKNADRHSNNNRLLVARLLFLVHFSSVGSSSGGGGPGENGNEAQNHGAYRTDPFFFLNKSIIKGTS